MTELYYYYDLLIRDNISNEPITTATIRPLTPPAQLKLEYTLEGDFYNFVQNSSEFIGWNDPTQKVPYGFRIQVDGYEEFTFYSDKPEDGNFTITLPTVTLIRKTANTVQESTIATLTETLNVSQTAPEYEKMKGIDKVGNIALTKSLNLRQTLIPSITSTIASFGITNINKLLTDPQSIGNLSTIICPSESKLLELIALRNKYITQVNSFYNSINRISKVTTTLGESLNFLNITLNTITTISNAANILLIGAIAAPGPVVSSQFTSKELRDTLKPKLTKFTRNLQYLSSVVQIISSILVTIVKLLNILDELIIKCAGDKDLALQTLNNELTQLGSIQIQELQNTTAKYKGFTFEILIDNSSNTKYPKRYAVAKDKFGVIVLKGESSYTPNPTILIEELKFIIDRDNLKGE